MKQDKISQEEMEKIEHHVNAVDDEIDQALQRHEQERKVKEERKLLQDDVDAKNRLADRIDIFLTEWTKIINRIIYAASFIDAQKFRKDLDPEMKELVKDFIVEIKKGIQPEIDRIMKVKNRVYLTRIWAYILGFTLFWTLAFMVAVITWNINLFHSESLSHIGWGFIGIWFLTVGLWVFLWHKYRWE